MARQTHQQQLARIVADNDNLKAIAENALRERDDALAESARLKREMVATTCTGSDDKLRSRLAVLMFPDLCTKDVGPDDLVCAALEYGKMIEVVRNMSNRPLTEVAYHEPLDLLTEINIELRKGEEAIEKVEGMPCEPEQLVEQRDEAQAETCALREALGLTSLDWERAKATGRLPTGQFLTID